jgi:hypothetical protein
MMIQWPFFKQDARIIALEASVVTEKFKVARPNVTLKRTLETEINTAGISWKQVGALPQNRVRWRFFEETLHSTYELQDYKRETNF